MIKIENMLFSASHRIAKNYRLDFNDVKSQAYLVFLEALELFDTEKGCKFETFLYSRLKTLGDTGHAKKEIGHRHSDIETIVYPVFADFERTLLIWDSIQTELSDDAKFVLFLICRHGKKITLLTMKRYCKLFLNWSAYQTGKVWKEIKIFWRQNYYLPVNLSIIDGGTI